MSTACTYLSNWYHVTTFVEEHYWKDVQGASFLLCVCYLYVDLGLGYLLNNIQLFAVYIISD